ncbi:MAG: glycosyltransferase family 4 protein [Longimicrobiales bacterium]
MRQFRIAALSSHPIQYAAPLYRQIATEPEIDLTVFYCSKAGLESFRDPGFGTSLKWDVPLLSGYRSEFLFNLRGRKDPGGFWSLINPGIVKRLLQGRFDALWLHGHNYATIHLGVMAALTTRTLLLMRAETHTGLARSPLKRWLRTPTLSAFYRLFGGFLAIGTRNQAFYRSLGIPDRKIFSMPYAVDNARFLEKGAISAERREGVRRELGLRNDLPLVLSSGKLIPRKRPADLVRAVALLNGSGFDVQLAFIGSGPCLDSLREIAKGDHSDRVHFLGFRNQARLPELYGVADLFVLPSENEPWGLAINEAMCAGLPVVTTDEVGAAPDLVREGENGFIYPAGDVAELADCIKRVLRRSDARQAMADRSREIISQWGYDACVRGLLEALEHGSTRGGRSRDRTG